MSTFGRSKRILAVILSLLVIINFSIVVNAAYGSHKNLAISGLVPDSMEKLENDACFEMAPLERNGDIFVIEVIVTVEDEVEKVEFKRWDVESQQFITMGTDYTPPYRVELDTTTLSPSWIQILITVYDPLENKICSGRVFIYKEPPTYLEFLPLILRPFIEFVPVPTIAPPTVLLETPFPTAYRNN